MDRLDAANDGLICNPCSKPPRVALDMGSCKSEESCGPSTPRDCGGSIAGEDRSRAKRNRGPSTDIRPVPTGSGREENMQRQSVSIYVGRVADQRWRGLTNNCEGLRPFQPPEPYAHVVCFERSIAPANLL